MKSLPETYRKYGYHFKLLKRNDMVAVFSQSTVPDLPKDGKACAYEVIVIQQRKPAVFTRGDKKIELEACEAVPHTEAWGRSAWTFPTKEAAYAKFNEITALLESRERKKALLRWVVLAK